MKSILVDMFPMISFPPNSHRLPVALSAPDLSFLLFDVLVHWIAYLIACIAVTVSLLICMAVVLFSFICLFELVIQTFNEAITLLKQGDAILQ